VIFEISQNNINNAWSPTGRAKNNSLEKMLYLWNYGTFFTIYTLYKEEFRPNIWQILSQNLALFTTYN